MADPYLQDDGRTLRNKLGIVNDPESLQQAETVFVGLRASELRCNGVPDAQGFGLVKAVHGYLFQDVYEWAGQVRTTSLSKLAFEGETARTTFTPPKRINQEGSRIFAGVEADRGFRGLDRDAFVGKLARSFVDLNELHPFREGNGRTQRLVWEHVARQAGHDLRFEGISQERMIARAVQRYETASILSNLPMPARLAR